MKTSFGDSCQNLAKSMRKVGRAFFFCTAKNDHGGQLMFSKLWLPKFSEVAKRGRAVENFLRELFCFALAKNCQVFSLFFMLFQADSAGWSGLIYFMERGSERNDVSECPFQ